jgi:putative ABC transport system permease protein
MSYIPLHWTDLVLAALLLLVNGLLSVAFRLGLERPLAIAAIRMVVQLGLIGFALKLLFVQTSILWVILAVLVMAGVAGHEVWMRQSSRVGLWPTIALGTGTLLFVSVATSAYVLTLVMGLAPWYTPRFFIPILGMILGSALTAVALAMETLAESAKLERAGIEARLAQGEGRYAAFERPLRRTLRTAMMPMINAMAVSGIVSLPGMMTGQILGGIDPAEAARYQIAVMFAIAGATGLSALMAALGGVWLLTDNRHRLRLDRIKTGGGRDVT